MFLNSVNIKETRLAITGASIIGGTSNQNFFATFKGDLGFQNYDHPLFPLIFNMVLLSVIGGVTDNETGLGMGIKISTLAFLFLALHYLWEI